MRNYFEWIYDTYSTLDNSIGKKLYYRGIPFYSSINNSIPNIIPVTTVDPNSIPIIDPTISFGAGFSHRCSILLINHLSKEEWIYSILNAFTNILNRVTQKIINESEIFSRKMRFNTNSPLPFNFVYNVEELIDPSFRYSSPTEISFNLIPFKLFLIRPDYNGTLPS